MDILIADRKLKRCINDIRQLTRAYGSPRAKRLRARLDEFRAAECLSIIRTLPHARCHELVGDLRGKLSVDLDHPYRLIFEPADEPVPTKTDGGLDWERVTRVRILEIADTHGD